jgi:hypothetical protein
VPAWAPASEAHVLRTSDVLVDVAYAAGSLRYRGTGEGTEEIRLPSMPKRVTFGGAELAPIASRDATSAAGENASTLHVEPMPGGGALVTLRRASAAPDGARAPVAIAW